MIDPEKLKWTEIECTVLSELESQYNYKFTEKDKAHIKRTIHGNCKYPRQELAFDHLRTHAEALIMLERAPGCIDGDELYIETGKKVIMKACEDYRIARVDTEAIPEDLKQGRTYRRLRHEMEDIEEFFLGPVCTLYAQNESIGFTILNKLQEETIDEIVLNYLAPRKVLGRFGQKDYEMIREYRYAKECFATRTYCRHDLIRSEIPLKDIKERFGSDAMHVVQQYREKIVAALDAYGIDPEYGFKSKGAGRNRKSYNYSGAKLHNKTKKGVK